MYFLNSNIEKNPFLFRFRDWHSGRSQVFVGSGLIAQWNPSGKTLVFIGLFESTGGNVTNLLLPSEESELCRNPVSGRVF